MLSHCARAGWIRNWARYARALKRIGDRFSEFGGDSAGMHVELQGAGHDGKPLAYRWTLIAGSGHGPQVPCVPAIVLARKMARGNLLWLIFTARSSKCSHRKQC